MRHQVRLAALATASLMGTAPLSAQRVDIGSGSAVEIVSRLKPGEYVWVPQVAPSGPMLLIVNVHTQRATLYRNGVPIGATTVSTGRPGFATPTGVFTILQKHAEHYSNKYDNAPMPYMQRLTWQGVALHAGQLPGYPASHGCIRLPRGFARLLYDSTKVGMTVVVTDQAASPRIAAAPDITRSSAPASDTGETVEWHPEKSPSGPVSIIVSSSDRKALVLRNGVVIGSGPVTVQGVVQGSWMYALRDVDASGQHWIRMRLSGADAGVPVAGEEWRQFRAPEELRRKIGAILEPGATIVVTNDSLAPQETNSGSALMESEPEGPSGTH
jgi:hypothetical protein